MSDPSSVIERLESRYRARFAGHPRVTREVEELEEMVTELGGLSADGAVADRIATLRQQWTDEIAQIRLAQSVPYAIPAARLRTWGDLSLSRYNRSFAGRDRATRDLGLLLEITADLQGIRTAMADLAQSAPEQGLDRNVTMLDTQLATHRSEQDAIRAARRQGTPAEQGSRLANLANHQFALYDRYFAGQSRISRHPSTLERILGTLAEIKRGMQSLQLAGFIDPSNSKNQQIVDQRIKAFESELASVKQARGAASLDDRVGALGGAANEIFGKYRENFGGKDRRIADPDLLDDLFERLWPIAREMDEIDAEHDHDTNNRNLRIVLDNLMLYGREHDAIRKARG